METKKQTLTGIVVSDKMEKTVVVSVTRTEQHPRYLKRYTISKRYKCHDEKNEAHVGDTVVIEHARPMSKEKRWKLVSIIALAHK
ncbi:MAG: 30S ribosomal protein S17 [Candidatus Harrisonbacteria bacterium CG10_big_fil_rev_8_21_14_0_10_42_17]|uniref:Small ribosomal subunit protein uS17 n=1 Tax=Candidatus Harrisonbacteria bacterium CG10_big_fil_rev_8_21_14_0_10_42_17 TaxID=1974584 RepID=A0A2M6WHM2_9BACT|nr:MAG: 30S ribosomal protein S17 [Candidatus Harrisonbacteria bacterium CG10_big_fil_rev_8_21_14_0_10_42_17]